jgi:hypothetical protein
VLAEIEALGLDLLEVRQLTPDRESPRSGDSCSPGQQTAKAIRPSNADAKVK